MSRDGAVPQRLDARERSVGAQRGPTNDLVQERAWDSERST